MYLCIHVRMNVCTYVCMCVCMYVLYCTVLLWGVVEVIGTERAARPRARRRRHRPRHSRRTRRTTLPDDATALKHPQNYQGLIGSTRVEPGVRSDGDRGGALGDASLVVETQSELAQHVPGTAPQQGCGAVNLPIRRAKRRRPTRRCSLWTTAAGGSHPRCP